RSPAIEIARVRSVLVPPGAARPTSAPLPLRGSTSPGFEEVLARADLPARRPVDPAADAAPAPMPNWAASSPANVPMHVTAAPTERPALFSGGASAPGAAPSTLGAQAANLSRGEPSVAPSPQPQHALAPREPAVPARKSVHTAAVPTAAAL